MTLPKPFGWRNSWIAVRNIQTELLVSELQLVSFRRCDWEEGLRAAGGEGIFVCPPVSGWTLIVGVTLPDAANDDTLPLIVRLSETHQSAQYFANHRVAEYYAWAKAESGRLARAYAFMGDRFSIEWDRGELTLEERDLGLTFDDPLAGTVNPDNPNESSLQTLQRVRANPLKRPKEHHVFAIARAWSIDPTRIEDYEASSSLGLLGFCK